MILKFQPELARAYDKKISAGKMYPLKNQDAYLGRVFERDILGDIKFSKARRPIFNRLENIYFCLGMPLPSVGVTNRIADFQSKLRVLFPNPIDMNLMDKASLHVTLFDHRWQKTSPNPSRHPFMEKPEALKEFIKSTEFMFDRFRPLTVFFRALSLFSDGAIVACGYPQDFPKGFPGMSSIDMIREGYIKHYPEAGGHPDITHISVARLLKKPTKNEHASTLSEIEMFNGVPLGSVTFDHVNVLYETRFLLSEIALLTKIRLG